MRRSLRIIPRSNTVYVVLYTQSPKETVPSFIIDFVPLLYPAIPSHNCGKYINLGDT